MYLDDVTAEQQRHECGVYTRVDERLMNNWGDVINIRLRFHLAILKSIVMGRRSQQVALLPQAIGLYLVCVLIQVTGVLINVACYKACI